jgi:hypothetical protein
LVRWNVSEGIGIRIGIGILRELESNSILCLVGRKLNWNPIPYSVWFVDMSDEFDFRNVK